MGLKLDVRSCLPLFSACALVACGGGDNNPAAGPAVAVVVSPASAKLPWNLATPLQVGLKDDKGTPLAGPYTCVSDTPSTLTVAADCSTATGMRLGPQSITVTSGAISAKASLKVIPQPQPLGSHGPASSNGSGGVNMVVTPDGRVLAWGANPGGVLGQGQLPTALPNLGLPTAVKDGTGQAALQSIVAVSVGVKSALALNEDGEVYSWGDNAGYVLGRGQTTNADPLPAKVQGGTGSGNLQHIVAVSIGDENAVALADDGTVYSWGYYSGQAGTDPHRTPGPVQQVGGGGTLTGAVAVSAGWNWSAALLADGRVAAWGFGSDGRQGQGVVTGPVATPGYVQAATNGQPVTGVVALSAGYNFGLALNASGQVYAWGANAYGQCGQGSLNNNLGQAVLVKDVAGTGTLGGIAMVAAGGNHALAQDSQGQVWSWGYSQDGQLGDSGSTSTHPRLNASALPAPVVGPLGSGQHNGAVALAAGYAQSLNLDADGKLWIWGAGLAGSLGQGSAATPAFLPLKVKNEAGTADLSLAPLAYWPNLLGRGR